MTTNEGGTIADENLANYARDRVETTSWVWLGLTANCACATTISSTRLRRTTLFDGAFFRNTTQGSHDGNIKDTKPVLYLPAAMDAPRYDALPGELATAHAAVGKRRGEAVKLADAWQAGVKPNDIDLAATGLVVNAPLAGGALPKGIAATEPLTWRPDGKLGSAPVFQCRRPRRAWRHGRFRDRSTVQRAFWVRPSATLNDGVLLARSPAKGAGPGWELSLFQGGKLQLAVNSPVAKSSIRIISRRPEAKPGAIGSTWPRRTTAPAA